MLSPQSLPFHFNHARHVWRCEEKSNDPRRRKKFQGINFQEFLYADDTPVRPKTSELLMNTSISVRIWRGKTNLSFTNFHHLAFAAKQKTSSNGISLRVPEAERHCIVQRTTAATPSLATPPSWSGSWPPVPSSMPWTATAVASELEESTRILRNSVGILASEHWICTDRKFERVSGKLTQIMHLNLLKLWWEKKASIDLK